MVTPDGVFRAIGDPQLNSVAGTLGRTITFDGTDDAAELECIPCISNLLNCMTGFTLQVDVNLKQAPASIEVMRDDTQIGYVAISEPNLVQSQTNSELISEESKQDASDDNIRKRRSAMQNNATQDVMDSKIRAASNKITYLIDSIEDPTRDMGMELFYDSSKLHVTLQANKGKWIIEAPYDLKLDTLYRIQVSWHPTGTLSLYVDGFLISETKRVSLPRVNYYQSRPLFLGRERNGQQDSTIALSELLIWMSTRDALQLQELIPGCSVFHAIILCADWINH